MKVDYVPAHKIEADVPDEAKDYIADKGFDKQYGARPLKRAIQKYVEDPLAEEIIQSRLVEGDMISIKLDEKKENIKIDIIKPCMICIVHAAS